MTRDNPTKGNEPKVEARWALVPWAWPFLAWLCHYPLLWLLALLLLAIIWGYLGVDFGVPYLFWAEDGWTQFFAAIGATWLLGKLCFIGYLLAGDADWMKRETGESRSLAWYLAVTWVPLLVLGLFLRTAIRAGGQDSFAMAFNDPSYWAFLFKHAPFLLGVVVGAAGAVVFLVLLEKLQSRFILIRLLHLPHLYEKLPPALQKQAQERRTVFVPRLDRDQVPRQVRLHALAGSFFGLLFLLYLVLVVSPWAYTGVTPALALCILLGLVADIYGMIRFHLPGAVYPGILLLVLAAALSGFVPHKHRLPGLDYTQDQPLDSNSYNARRQEDCGLVKQSALEPWLTYYTENHALNSKTDRPKILIVATSGGGIRAALWTAVVLNELEKSLPGFFYHVRLITGASGGMLGAAHFTAKLDELQKFDHKNHFRASGPADEQLLARRAELLQDLKIVDNLEKGGLDAIAQYCVLQDAPRIFCPMPYSKDRGWALEQAWSKNLEGALDCTLRSLGAGEKQGWRPSLVFAPMLVEDGRRLLISNLDLDQITKTHGSLLKENDVRKDLYSLSAVEFFRLFPKADEFLLSTAVRLNASFPYVAPVATLPTKPSRRVVDAGYYDNYGIDVAACWIFDNRAWIEENTSGVVLIQIRDAQSQGLRQQLGTEEEYDQASWFARGLEGLTTPPAGERIAQGATMSFRNDEQLHVLSDLLNKRPPQLDRFTTLVIECPVHAELNWSLTKSEITAIRAGITGQITNAMQEILGNHPQYEEIKKKNRSRIEGIRGLLQSR